MCGCILYAKYKSKYFFLSPVFVFFFVVLRWCWSRLVKAPSRVCVGELIINIRESEWMSTEGDDDNRSRRKRDQPVVSLRRLSSCFSVSFFLFSSPPSFLLSSSSPELDGVR